MSSSNSSISVFLEQIDDETLRLSLGVRAKDFYVSGHAFFEFRALCGFVQNFRSYPIDTKEIPTIAGGIWSDGGLELIEKHISISVRPIDRVGGLIMSVEAFTPDHEEKMIGLGRGGRCDFLINYNAVNEFADLMSLLLDNRGGEIEFNSFINNR